MRKRTLLFLGALLLLAGAPARADVGIVLNEALGSGGDKFSSTGHSAVYFSRICPETPIKLRLCHEGEQGSVLSNYTGLGESEPFEWNVAPLDLFLYGVNDPQRWPLVASPKIKALLEERYRKQYLSALCTGEPCTTSEKADWRYMVGAGLDRSLYIFVVETTVAQDAEIIEKFNSLPNENHFNVITHNCANFTKEVISTYFPHSTHRDYLNDMGMTSPKALARTFTSYAKQHPEMKLHVLHFVQAPGSIKRSKEVRDGSELLYRSPFLIAPLAIFVGYALPAAVVTYTVTGRFNPEHESEARPNEHQADLAAQLKEAKESKDKPEVERLQAVQRADHDRMFGTDQEWNDYRKQFQSLVDEAVESGIVADGKHLENIFDQIDDAGTPYMDATHTLWVEMQDGERKARVGITSSNIMAPGSDPQLAYRLLLARTDRALKDPKHSRESMLAFKVDWTMLEAARKRARVSLDNAKAAANHE
jgi:hypothetical protein